MIPKISQNDKNSIHLAQDISNLIWIFLKWYVLVQSQEWKLYNNVKYVQS